MTPFLYVVAEDINNNSGKFSNFCIVLPNKRTSTFFKKYFAEIQQKSVWAPNIFTIDDLLKKLSFGIKSQEKTSLLVDLYSIADEVFKKSENSDYFSHYTFDRFFGVGEIILNDFNDIDNYLLNAKDIFRNIQNLEEIDLIYNYLSDEHKQILKEFWLSFSPEQRSEEKQKFLLLWEKLPEIYEKFTTGLLAKKCSYGGLRNREITRLIDDNKLNTNHYDKYLFVGFNALNKAEKKLFTHLKNIDKAIFYWDYDNYYVTDNKQEAGFFMRDNLKAYTNRLPQKKDLLKTIEKDIKVIGVPLNVGQAKALSTIFSELKKQDEFFYNNTAIILADEHLLFPVLHSLPPEIPNINITMGYPLKETTLYGFLVDYLQIQSKISQKNDTQIKFYYKDVVKILKHPEIWTITKEISANIIKDIESKNRIYLKPQYFTDYKNELLSLIFSTVNASENPVMLLLNNILNLLFVLFTKNESTTAKPIENEYIYLVYTEIKKLKDTIQTNSEKVDFSLNISIKLLKQILSSVRIPFEGKHSEGLQIMGLMETRNLDFKNVIILSVNEGVLPDTGRKPSFISENLRVAFGLPVIKFQDSIFAYFFYRILQRAENVYMLYNSIIGNNSGEISRFIQQLKFESSLTIEEKQFKQKLKPSTVTPIEISKNQQVLSTLNSYFAETNLQKKFFSASALNTYIDCSLKFYFKYVAFLKAKTEVAEEITPVTFGNILHYAIEKIYSDFLERKQNKLIEKSDFVALNSMVEEHTEKSFRNFYNISEKSNFEFEGTNIVVKEVVIINLKNILKIDALYAPFEIIDLEQEHGYNAEIEVSINEKPEKISLWGIFDRIDCKDGYYRIIDYKTGSAEKSFSSIESLFDAKNAARQTAIFQMFYYSYILTQKLDNYKNKCFPGIYNLREMNSDNFSPDLIYKPDRDNVLNVNSKVISDLLPEFEEYLSLLISNIFNPDLKFVQTENQNNCKYCDFSEICNR